jgi:hypothetical protein
MSYNTTAKMTGNFAKDLFDLQKSFRRLKAKEKLEQKEALIAKK